MEAFGPSCPWYDSLQTFGPANVKWCEERVCGWINEPANTWSNLGYLAAGLWIARHAKGRDSRAGLAFGAVVFVMGALSLFYHATNNFLTQAFDFTGMFLMVFFVIASNARRLGWPRRGLEALYGVSVVGWTIALWPLSRLGAIQWIVAATAVIILVTELLARARNRETRPMGLFWTTLVVLVAAESCSLADMKRLWCDPSNHWLQGHAAWHMIAAAAMPTLYLYYASDFDSAWAKAPAS